MSDNNKNEVIVVEEDTTPKVETKYLYMPEIKDDYDRAKFSLVSDFPACYQTIDMAIECNRSHGVAPDVLIKPCKEIQGHMRFCLLSTFCPKQASLLVDCMKGRIPLDEQQPIPKNCLKFWNDFDSCLGKATDDFETKNNPLKK
ncbi:hypothetical protein DFA_03548 [Cavenderia fasciculata]|uniref:Uncharacterized protein n=1 Tax=Cavenderia fasciculata TaxID=261658 RepID=F4PHW5_CACFS|nr:uncharacterized protein DFA_03548 [Cavenderia fasciculata]EGG25299.1 hypothetical protein DFA_03548 [Cavenderia fasciculata]|eukprot:XP_004363150.1 hypothetical protein DFA_03548 [Cavenderia fasciculata]